MRRAQHEPGRGRHRVAWWAMPLVLVLLLAACGDGADDGDPAAEGDGDAETTDGSADDEDEAPAAERRTVTIALPVPSVSVTLAPYTSLPQQLGFADEENLDWDVVIADGSAEAVQYVAAGQADLAMVNASPMFLSAARGIDTISYFTVVNRNNFPPVVPEDSDIQTFADFEGATIGVVSPEGGTVPMIRAMMIREGADPDAADFVGGMIGPPGYEALRSGRIDGLALFDTAHADIEAMGQPLRVISNDFFDDLGFMTVMAAQQSALEDDPEFYVRAARAMTKAFVFEEENPEAAVRAHWEVYPESRPEGVDEADALARALRDIDLRQSKWGFPDGTWGATTTEQVEQHMELLVEGGQLEEPVDIDEVWTDALIADINDFDEEAVRQQAADHEDA
jgi:NitT/TauT family transport system substrate-binding protein